MYNIIIENAQFFFRVNLENVRSGTGRFECVYAEKIFCKKKRVFKICGYRDCAPLLVSDVFKIIG